MIFRTLIKAAVLATVITGGVALPAQAGGYDPNGHRVNLEDQGCQTMAQVERSLKRLKYKQFAEVPLDAGPNYIVYFASSVSKGVTRYWQLEYNRCEGEVMRKVEIDNPGF